MRFTRRTLLQATAASTAAFSMPAQARPGVAKIYVGFAAGGTLDTIARRMAELTRGTVADSVIVEGRTGAGGRIAIEATKASAPDGSAMTLTPSSPMVIFPHVYKALSYDPFADLTPITPVCSNAQTFVVGPAVPAEIATLAQFVDYAKKNKVFYATPAAGSIMHFQGLVFSQQAGIELTHAPYRGMAAIIPDLLGGTMQTSMAVTGDVLPHIATGKLRPLAVTSAQRSRFLPNVPTFAELGLDRVTGIDWYALFAPPKTPPSLAAEMQKACHAAMQDASLKKLLEELGFDLYQLTGAELTERMRAETARWAPVVKASGFQLDN